MNANRHAVLGAIVAAALCSGCETTGTTSSGAAPAALRAASVQDTGGAEDDLWVLTSRPGAGHRILDGLAGRWKATVRIWEHGTDEPKTLTGVVTREWILGERFLKGMPKIEGPDGTLEGLSLIGYNVFDGVYEFVWLENERTSIAFDTGRYDDRRKLFTFRGTLRDHSSGFLLETRTTYDVSDPNRHEVTGYTTDQNGVEERGFVVVFERMAPEKLGKIEDPSSARRAQVAPRPSINPQGPEQSRSRAIQGLIAWRFRAVRASVRRRDLP